jgi:hypothetical protein
VISHSLWLSPYVLALNAMVGMQLLYRSQANHACGLRIKTSMGSAGVTSSCQTMQQRKKALTFKNMVLRSLGFVQSAFLTRVRVKLKLEPRRPWTWTCSRAHHNIDILSSWYLLLHVSTALMIIRPARDARMLC